MSSIICLSGRPGPGPGVGSGDVAAGGSGTEWHLGKGGEVVLGAEGPGLTDR